MFGGNTNTSPRPNPKALGLNENSTGTNEQGNPLPYLAGKRRFAGTFISDAFNQRAVTVGGGGKDAGKGGGGQGTNYYASFGVAFCLGVVDGFHELHLNGDNVFTSNVLIYPDSLEQTSNVATFTATSAHLLETGDAVIINGADQPEFNGEFVITVVNDLQFTYTIPGSSLGSSTASGDITCAVRLDPIYRGTEDYIEVTIPTYGRMRLYWGTETQTADTHLQISGTNHSPMHGVCYAVFEQFFLGLNQTNIQNVEIVLSRTPTATWLSDPLHADIEDEANPAVVFYDLLTNPRCGLGLQATDFNTSELATAAETFYTEGLGISPIITRSDSASAIMQQLCETVDASVNLDTNGLLTLLPIRAPASYAITGSPPPIFTVNDSILADIPNPKAGDWSNTYSETKIVFPNRDALFLNDFVEWKDFSANTSAQMVAQPQELTRDWITRRANAILLCQSAATTAAIPEITGSADILFTPTNWEEMKPGTIFYLSYTLRPTAAGYYRVKNRTMSDPEKMFFTIEYAADRSYLNTSFAGL